MSLLIDQVPEGAEVGPAQLKAYLMTAGWSLVRADAASASELWEVEADGPRRTQVVLPLDPTFVDYRRRLSDSLQRLCEVYSWDLSELVRSIQAIRSDLILIRADQLTRFDSIPLRQAEQLLHGTVQMLQAAAWSTVSPRASLTGRKPDVVKQFLDDDVRMGHTRRGSFVLTVLARVDDEPVEVESELGPEGVQGENLAVDTSPPVRMVSPPGSSPRSEDTRVVLPPFQRRVVSTLATGLKETKELTEIDFSSDRIESSVGQGASAQLCDSLSSMTQFEGLRALEISFQWTPLPQFEAPQILSVSIGRDNIGALDGLKERFRAREDWPDNRATIYGRIVRLERTTAEQRDQIERQGAEAVVTIVGVEGRKTRRQARMEVLGELHQIAIRSYELQRPITVTGELHREKSGYWLRGDISVVEQAGPCRLIERNAHPEESGIRVIGQ